MFVSIIEWLALLFMRIQFFYIKLKGRISGLFRAAEQNLESPLNRRSNER